MTMLGLLLCAAGPLSGGVVDWQELSVSSRGMSSASCYSFNLCRRDKELLFDSECFADGERLKFYEVPVTAEELTPLDKLIQQLPWQLRQPSASRPANLPREMIEVHDCGSFSLTLLTATGEKLVCRTDIEQQQELLRELQRLVKQVHEQAMRRCILCVALGCSGNCRKNKHESSTGCVFGRNFLEKQKNFTHPTRNRQFGWGALAHSVVQ